MSSPKIWVQLDRQLSGKTVTQEAELNPLGQTVAHISFQSIIFKRLKGEVLMFVAMRHAGV